MARTKATARRNDGPTIFVPRPQGDQTSECLEPETNHGKEN